MKVAERGDGVLRRRGPILLISCYELGHQPLSIASAAAFLERAGYMPDTLDISVESFDVESVVRARFVGISVLCMANYKTLRDLAIRHAQGGQNGNPGSVPMHVESRDFGTKGSLGGASYCRQDRTRPLIATAQPVPLLPDASPSTRPANRDWL